MSLSSPWLLWKLFKKSLPCQPSGLSCQSGSEHRAFQRGGGGAGPEAVSARAHPARTACPPLPDPHVGPAQGDPDSYTLCPLLFCPLASGWLVCLWARGFILKASSPLRGRTEETGKPVPLLGPQDEVSFWSTHFSPAKQGHLLATFSAPLCSGSVCLLSPSR